MDINHPLYLALKDYYTNLSDDIHNYNNFYSDDHIDEKNDNSLLFQYIEDTYGVEAEDDVIFNFNYFKSSLYPNCCRLYFVNIKINEMIEVYCYFTNKLLNSMKNNRLIFIRNIGNYKYIALNYGKYNVSYLYKNTD
jgi:hypothetical protein